MRSGVAGTVVVCFSCCATSTTCFKQVQHPITCSHAAQRGSASSILDAHTYSSCDPASVEKDAVLCCAVTVDVREPRYGWTNYSYSGRKKNGNFNTVSITSWCGMVFTNGCSQVSYFQQKCWREPLIGVTTMATVALPLFLYVCSRFITRLFISSVYATSSRLLVAPIEFYPHQ